MSTTVQQAQSAVVDLPAQELAEFRRWFEEYDAQAWDRQFERDAKSGKLDALAEQALADLEAVKCREL